MQKFLNKHILILFVVYITFTIRPLLLLFFRSSVFSHSNSKQTTNKFVLLWCLFTANKPCNDIGRGPNRNPADPVSYGCETVFTPPYNKCVRSGREWDSSHSISSTRGPDLGTNTILPGPVVEEGTWTCSGSRWWFTVMAHWKRCTFQFVLVFLIGKITGSRCDGDKSATTLTSTSDLSGCFKHTWKTIGNISWCMAPGQIRRMTNLDVVSLTFLRRTFI